MKVIITEKPAMASDIARLAGANSQRNSYYEGNDYLVTWTNGFLVNLMFPDHPATIPQEFKLSPLTKTIGGKSKPDPVAKKQLDTIKQLIKRSDSIIVATAPGEEGELIFRYIYYFLGGTIPYYRLWISSLTDQAITEGLNNLKPGYDLNGLYKMAKARSIADWLAGSTINRALSQVTGKNRLNLSRLQIPVLNLICENYTANRSFIPSTFYQFSMRLKSGENEFTVLSKERTGNKEEANRIYEELKENVQVDITNYITQTEKIAPPLLHNLATLQIEANELYGFTTLRTEELTLNLYRKKYITYPYTDSRHITKKCWSRNECWREFELTSWRGWRGFESVPLPSKDKAQMNICASEADIYTSKTSGKQLKLINDKKVIYHPAIQVTNLEPSGLKKEEQQLYDLIAVRMLESISQEHIRQNIEVECHTNGITFTGKGYRVEQPGWQSISPAKEKTDRNQSIPELKQGDQPEVISLSLITRKTVPVALFTEATLLAYMAITHPDNQKQKPIGTPVDRGHIIEGLIRDKYIQRDKNHLLPTDKGMYIYQQVKNTQVADWKLTEQWEESLRKIATDPDSYETFLRSFTIFSNQATNEIMKQDFSGRK